VTYALIGTVYLLHFDKPYQHAAHYLGWSSNLPVRLVAHECGRGARLTEVVAEAGIRWVLTRTWPGATRDYERALKNQGGRGRLCPACGVTPRPWPPSPEWTAVLRNGIAVSLNAECRRCKQRKGVMEFDLTGRTRRVCLECIDRADAKRRARALIGAAT
jgi:predicted GIY-YIG superfamily endonuclease